MGPRGPQGLPGPQGMQGMPGPRGEKGAPGFNGLDGERGFRVSATHPWLPLSKPVWYGSVAGAHVCFLFVCLLVFSSWNPAVHPVLGEKVACAAVSPHLHILLHIQVQCFPPYLQLRYGFGNFNNGVMSWRLLWLNGTQIWNSAHLKHFASAPTFWLETTRCQ